MGRITVEQPHPDAVAEPPAQLSDCPFAALSMGKAQIEQYLSDAKERLRRGELRQVGNARQLWYPVLRLCKQDPGLLVETTQLEDRVQQALVGQVVQFRNRTFCFAWTLVEAVSMANKGNTAIADDCFGELQVLDREIKETFKDSKTMLTEMVCSLNSDVARHLHTSLSAAAHHGSGLCCAGIAAFSALIGCLTPAIGLFKPTLLENLDATRAWFAPTHKDRNGTVHYSAVPWKIKLTLKCFLGLLSLGAFGVAVAFLARWRAQRQAKEAERQRTVAAVKAQAGKFVQQNSEMWRGMFMWVEDVERSITRLRSLHTDRLGARDALMRDIASKLFGMSMAVDEYIFWLNGHNMFPPNFSIRNLLTPDRYDRIQSIATAVEGAQ